MVGDVVLEPSIAEVLAEQRRRRRLFFWAGFAGLAITSGAWAFLGKEPVEPFFGDVMDEAEPAMVDAEGDVMEAEPVPTTTAVSLAEETTTIGPVEDQRTTIGPPSEDPGEPEGSEEG